MSQKTKKDMWVEMSIREIWTQAHYAEIAYTNIDPTSVDKVFLNTHSFLTHCALISKMLMAKDYNPPKKGLKNFFYRCLISAGLYKKPVTINLILDAKESPLIHNRKLRNHLEHYDERLKEWIGRHGTSVPIGDFNVGPKSAISVSNIVHVRHYDPGTKVFTFVNQEYNLQELFDEIKIIKEKSDRWVKDMESSLINPPFI